MNYTEADFDRLSLHDCHIWAIELRPGDPDEDDWTSDLALDIDFIAEWICAVGEGGQFRVAPATLLFHGVTDPRIAIDWGAREPRRPCIRRRSTVSSASRSRIRGCSSTVLTTVGESR